MSKVFKVGDIVQYYEIEDKIWLTQPFIIESIGERYVNIEPYKEKYIHNSMTVGVGLPKHDVNRWLKLYPMYETPIYQDLLDCELEDE